MCSDDDIAVDEVQVQVADIPCGHRRWLPEVTLSDLGEPFCEVFGHGVQHGYVHSAPPSGKAETAHSTNVVEVLRPARCELPSNVQRVGLDRLPRHQISQCRRVDANTRISIGKGAGPFAAVGRGRPDVPSAFESYRAAARLMVRG